MDIFKVKRFEFRSLKIFVLKPGATFLICNIGFCVLFCFPDMVRKKKTENDWFKIQTASYISEGRQLRVHMKGFVKNSDLESLQMYEAEEDENFPERSIYKKEKNIGLGQFSAKSEPFTKETMDWIRKIGTTRKWIRIELNNMNGMKTELQTELLVSESDKKVLRKDLSIEAEGEIIRLDGREWKIISELNTGEQALLQYIPKTEFALFWTEMISIHVYKVKSSQPEQIYFLLETAKKKDCPTVVWKKESVEKEKIWYFWEHSGCGKQSTMSEIAKLYRGEYGIYNVRYDRKRKITDDEKKRWFTLLEKLPGK